MARYLGSIKVLISRMGIIKLDLKCVTWLLRCNALISKLDQGHFDLLLKVK